MIKNGVITVKRITLDTIAVLLVLITPFLRYYSVPVLKISFETLITFLLLGLTGLLFGYRMYQSVPRELNQAKRWFGLLWVWLLLVTLGYEIFTDINMNAPDANYNFNSIFLFALRGPIIYFLLSGRVKTESAISIYSFLIALLIVVYLAQWMMLLAGLRISFKLPFAYDTAWNDILRKKIFGMNGYPTGLFSEKSHFCEFVCPYIAMCLYGDGIVRKNRIKKAIICSVCVATTVSGNGIILLAVMWILYFVIFGQFKAKRYRILVALVGAAMLVGAYFVLSGIPRFKNMFDILFVDNSGSAFENTKADYRIYRGLDLFTKLPLNAQLTGVGYPHMFLYSQKYDIVSVYDRGKKAYEYFSSVSMILLYGGLIGFAFCTQHFYGLMKNKSKIVKGLVIIMAALWFSTEMLFRSTHIMYILLITAVILKEKDNQKEEGSPCE